MKIYLIKNQLGGFRTIKPQTPESHNHLLDGYGTPLLASWAPITFTWDTEDGQTIPDSFLYLGSILIANEKCTKQITSTPGNEDIECLPINIEGEHYYIINTCITESNLLNTNNSKIEYFKDKSIKWIREYIFYPQTHYPPLFHIAQIATPLFASEAFVNTYINSNFTGLKFEECKQKNTSILKSIFKR